MIMIKPSRTVLYVGTRRHKVQRIVERLWQPVNQRRLLRGS